MDTVLIHGQAGLILFEAVLLLIAISNLRAWRRLGSYPPPETWPSVSVLVPARNEAANIGPCVRSLLAQAYPDFRVLVLDDHSTDETWSILSGLAAADGRLQLLAGRPLPAGWLGKHWACHQLARAANGELLLFTDADTRHRPDTLRESVAALLAEEADLLTALPRQEVVTWAERLVVPLIPWSIFAFVPLAVAYRWPQPMLSATIGQFMLFRRRAFEAIGGYEAVRHHLTDDLALGRRAVAHGHRWRLVDAGRHVHCRMYRDHRQVFEGISKNLFAAFEYKVLPFVFIWLWLGVVFLAPWLIVGLGLAGVGLPAGAAGLAVASILGALGLWGLAHWRFGFPRYLAGLYPVTVFLAVVIALRSMVLTLGGRVTWKDRTVVRQETG